MSRSSVPSSSSSLWTACSLPRFLSDSFAVSSGVPAPPLLLSWAREALARRLLLGEGEVAMVATGLVEGVPNCLLGMRMFTLITEKSFLSSSSSCPNWNGWAGEVRGGGGGVADVDRIVGTVEWEGKVDLSFRRGSKPRRGVRVKIQSIAECRRCGDGTRESGGRLLEEENGVPRRRSKKQLQSYIALCAEECILTRSADGRRPSTADLVKG